MGYIPPRTNAVQTRLEEATAAAAQAQASRVHVWGISQSVACLTPVSLLQDAAATAERALEAERRSKEALAAESSALTAAAGSSSVVAADLLKRVAALDAQVSVRRGKHATNARRRPHLFLRR